MSAIQQIADKAAALTDDALRAAAREAEQQQAAAIAAGSPDAKHLTTVLIGLNHAADRRWVDPQTYTEAVEDAIDAEIDKGHGYVEALYLATH